LTEFSRSAALEGFFSMLRSERADVLGTPLPGTRLEAEAIHRQFPRAQLLLGANTTKSSLLKLAAPGLLHIATPCFFLGDVAPPRTAGNDTAVSAVPGKPPADPWLRSGLVFAGIRPEDSLVTALELAGLNLWGTQLVMLSACDTGRGALQTGQGFYGLRRAFLAAGAETVVTSLWKVHDEVRRQFLEDYYRNLLSGQSRTTALRQAMQELRFKHPHPHFWAPFIAIGQDAPLRDLMPTSTVQTAP
jgi:CHAT domain-containing protein